MLSDVSGVMGNRGGGQSPRNPGAGNQLSMKNVQVWACVLTGVLGMKSTWDRENLSLIMLTTNVEDCKRRDIYLPLA